VAAKGSTSRKKPAGKKPAPKKPAPKPKAKAAAAARASAPAKAARPPAAKATPPKLVAAVKKPAPAAKPVPARPAPRKAARPVPAAAPEPVPVPAAPAETAAPEPRVPRGLREPRAHPDSGLSKAQVKRLHQHLLEERNAVLIEIRRSVQGAVEEVPVFTESIDQAQHETEQNFRLRMADKQRKLLNEIQAALLKFEEGEYGICEGTEEPIGYARLEVRPWARYSVEYKEMKDRRER
jgi:DnaK suppressor protein